MGSEAGGPGGSPRRGFVGTARGTTFLKQYSFQQKRHGKLETIPEGIGNKFIHNR
jgi:hypothetical protein